MKVVILAGGRGERFRRSGSSPPKPLAEIGGRPILWHLARYYGHFGDREFVLALGHRGAEVQKWLRSVPEVQDGSWVVDAVDTGEATATGGRLKRLQQTIGQSTFALTYADGLADVDLRALLEFHRGHGRLATVTAVHPPARFGYVEIDGARVSRFSEKQTTRAGWINGGFFILEEGVFDYIDGDTSGWERDCLPAIAAAGELMAFRHEGFWHCMDTEADQRELDCIWGRGAPWKVWEEGA